MEKRTPKKRAGMIVGAVVTLFIILGVAGGHRQSPKVELNSTPTGSTQSSSQSTPKPANTNTSNTPAASNETPAPTPTPAPSSTDSPNTGLSDNNLSNNNTYTNVDGTTVHSPASSTNGTVPASATAQCSDGTYSFSQHHSGTCSHHGGVATWL